MTKQEVIEACMMAAYSNASKEDVTGFAAKVWKDHFSHIDFVSWNREIPSEQAKLLIAEARSRQIFEVKDLITHLS